MRSGGSGSTSARRDGSWAAAKGPTLPASAASFRANARVASRYARQARPRDRASPAAAYLPSLAKRRGARLARPATFAAPAGRLHAGWRRDASADGGDHAASSSVVILQVDVNCVFAVEGEWKSQIAGRRKPTQRPCPPAFAADGTASRERSCLRARIAASRRSNILTMRAMVRSRESHVLHRP